MNRDMQDLNSARVQTTSWIRFMVVEVEDENGNVIGVDGVEKAFNSQMTDIFQGSDLNKSKIQHWKIADLDSIRLYL